MEMITTPMEMRALAFELTTSVWTAGAIATLFESGLAPHLREPCSLDDLAAERPDLPRARIERCLAVAACAGVVVADGQHYRLAEGVLPFLQQPARAALLGDLRSMLMQTLALLDSSRGGVEPGWRHRDPALLTAQGDTSGGFPPMFKANIVASLGDLAARLDRPGARVLDVGVGVGALAIAMCGAFPAVSVVGLDTFDVPLAIARDRVAQAGLADRIELRQLAVEDLRDEEAFDLAWMPSFFLPASVLPAAAARVRASLRPGGWILFPIGTSSGDDRHRAVLALVCETWGGPALSPLQAESLLGAAGFASVRTMPGPPWAPTLVAAQR
jgi:hypothetical protein